MTIHGRKIDFLQVIGIYFTERLRQKQKIVEQKHWIGSFIGMYDITDSHTFQGKAATGRRGKEGPVNYAQHCCQYRGSQQVFVLKYTPAEDRKKVKKRQKKTTQSRKRTNGSSTSNAQICSTQEG